MAEGPVAQPNWAWSKRGTKSPSTCVEQNGVDVGDSVAVTVGVLLVVIAALGVMVTVAVIRATWVGETTARLFVGVGSGVAGPSRLDRMMNAAPTPKAKSATTAVTPTHTQLERGARISSSSGTMSKSSASGT